MKPIIKIIVIAIFGYVNIYGNNADKIQLLANDTIKKIIFVPHPRSDSRTVQSTIKSVELIKYSLFDMILLGGDLTYYTTTSRTSMDYCDSIFNLGDENTLWAVGNHDLSNKSLIEEYTFRPTYYTYYSDNVTYLVLDTEIGSSGFNYSHITGEQLEFVQNAADTISKSDYLVIIHHRLLWMVGNDYFATKIDSVGASTRELDTSNFNIEVLPLLQNVKKKGIKVLCLGGDRSNFNIAYTHEDSITFFTSTMATNFTDDENHVIVFTQNVITNNITWEFISLNDIEKYEEDTNTTNIDNKDTFTDIAVYPNPSTNIINIDFKNLPVDKYSIDIFDINGRLVLSEIIVNNYGIYPINLKNPGLYNLVIKNNKLIYVQKVILK